MMPFTLNPPCALPGSEGFVVLGVSLTDSAANLMTFRQRSSRADLTTDPPSVRGLCNRDSLFMQYFEDRR
jgi:hypothetical protein